MDDTIVEHVERHSRAVAKDLIQLMLIDQQFISKVC